MTTGNSILPNNMRAVLSRARASHAAERAHERQSLRLSNAPRERRIAAEHARARAAIDAAKCVLAPHYHVLPRGEVDTGAISSILGDWYHAEIRSIADELIATCRRERGIDPWPKWQTGNACDLRDASEDAVREWVSERVDEDTDGHEYVIYTHKARLVLVASDNADSYDEEIGVDGSASVEAKACWAMRADVWEVLHAREDEWLTVEPPDEDPDPDPTTEGGDPIADERAARERGGTTGLALPDTIEMHVGHGGTCGLTICTAAHELHGHDETPIEMPGSSVLHPTWFGSGSLVGARDWFRVDPGNPAARSNYVKVACRYFRVGLIERATLDSAALDLGIAPDMMLC